MNKPFVSISCLTYNHVNYIKDAIDGFLMQKTDFDFEILIHDDASTDGTTKIIKEYEKKYPNIIKPLYEEENQWQKGQKGSAVFNFPRAQGKYIALCEGDDYWTDPYKLQKQVDFLEKNEGYSACGTYCDILRPNGLHKISDTPQKNVSFEDLLIGKASIPTLTLCFRNGIVNLKNITNCSIGDLPLLLELTIKKNNIAKLPFNSAVYRYHGKGANSGKKKHENISIYLTVRCQYYKVNRDKISKKHLLKFIFNILFKEIKNIIKFREFDYKTISISLKYLIKIITC